MAEFMTAVGAYYPHVLLEQGDLIPASRDLVTYLAIKISEGSLPAPEYLKMLKDYEFADVEPRMIKEFVDDQPDKFEAGVSPMKDSDSARITEVMKMWRRESQSPMERHFWGFLANFSPQIRRAIAIAIFAEENKYKAVVFAKESDAITFLDIIEGAETGVSFVYALERKVDRRVRPWDWFAMDLKVNTLFAASVQVPDGLFVDDDKSHNFLLSGDIKFGVTVTGLETLNAGKKDVKYAELDNWSRVLVTNRILRVHVAPWRSRPVPVIEFGEGKSTYLKNVPVPSASSDGKDKFEEGQAPKQPATRVVVDSKKFSDNVKKQRLRVGICVISCNFRARVILTRYLWKLITNGKYSTYWNTSCIKRKDGKWSKPKIEELTLRAIEVTKKALGAKAEGVASYYDAVETSAEVDSDLRENGGSGARVAGETTMEKWDSRGVIKKYVRPVATVPLVQVVRSTVPTAITDTIRKSVATAREVDAVEQRHNEDMTASVETDEEDVEMKGAEKPRMSTAVSGSKRKKGGESKAPAEEKKESGFAGAADEFDG
jgi:hypothetical protein